MYRCTYVYTHVWVLAQCAILAHWGGKHIQCPTETGAQSTRRSAFLNICACDVCICAKAPGRPRRTQRTLQPPVQLKQRPAFVRVYSPCRVRVRQLQLQLLPVRAASTCQTSLEKVVNARRLGTVFMLMRHNKYPLVWRWQPKEKRQKLSNGAYHRPERSWEGFQSMLSCWNMGARESTERRDGNLTNRLAGMVRGHELLCSSPSTVPTQQTAEGLRVMARVEKAFAAAAKASRCSFAHVLEFCNRRGYAQR
jgi:hypothetical protein